MENRTARLTLLIDPEKKAAFEELCKQEDVTPSQKVRQFIREYVEEKNRQLSESSHTRRPDLLNRIRINYLDFGARGHTIDECDKAANLIFSTLR